MIWKNHGIPYGNIFFKINKIKFLCRKKAAAKRKKALPSKNGNSNENEENNTVIYLIPEFVYATGTDTSNDSSDKRRMVISKTKMDPNKKIEEIGKIRGMMTSNEAKNYNRKDGNLYTSKSSNEIAQEWVKI